MVYLHERLVYPILVDSAKETVRSGVPIIRPMWFADNLDSRLLTIDDQFMVGDKILVAPILEPNSVQRDIYLPVGSWQSEGDGKIYQGPIYLRNYPVPIEIIAYFIRLT